VAKALVENIKKTSNAEPRTPNIELSFDPFSYQRRTTEKIERSGVKLGGDELIRVVVRQASYDKIAHKIEKMGDYKPEIVYENAQVEEVDPRDEDAIARLNETSTPRLVMVKDDVDLPVISAFRLLATRLQARHPILLKDALLTDHRSQIADQDFLTILLTASTNIGSLLCDGIGDAILVQGEEAPGQALRLSYNILQAAGSRIFKTDYVACPSCGR